jgi:uncharacterized FAD-dependent dehydrogenase
MSTSVDVLVIGAGPAGLMAADRLAGKARALVVDAGRAYQRRPCPVDRGRQCHGCGGICNVISGFGGSIHYGDGVKLSRFPSGRRLAELLGDARSERLSDEAVDVLCADDEPTFRTAETAASPFPLKDYPVAQLSSAQVRSIIVRLHDRLAAHPSSEVRMQTLVTALEPRGPSSWSARLRGPDGYEQDITARAVIAAVGRRGQRWWHEQVRTLGLRHRAPTPSVGLRFECPKQLLRRGSEIHGDFKTTLVCHGVKVKTFCFCAGPGGGRIKFTDYGDHTLLDGHVIPEHLPGGTANFALLAQLKDGRGRPRDAAWVESQLLAPYRALRQDRPGKPVLQWFPDFRDGALRCNDLREFEARAGFSPSLRDYRIGNLARILPPDVHSAMVDSFHELMGFFNAAPVAEPIASQVGVIGLELESLWDELDLSDGMQTSLPGLYAAGDCTGLAQGILQAAVGGLAAADSILCVASRPIKDAAWAR